jgi:endonuclease YncB( thermonuclease family)
MRVARRSAVVALLAVAAAPASAGAPKTVRLSDVTITKQRAVRVTLETPAVRSKATLAQISVDPRLRMGRGCRAQRGDRAVADVALELGLDRAARVASEPRTKDRTAYVFQANGPNDSSRRSLNMILVRRGIARVTSAVGSLRGAFNASERKARQQHRGRWACRR